MSLVASQNPYSGSQLPTQSPIPYRWSIRPISSNHVQPILPLCSRRYRHFHRDLCCRSAPSSLRTRGIPPVQSHRDHADGGTFHRHEGARMEDNGYVRSVATPTLIFWHMTATLPAHLQNPNPVRRTIACYCNQSYLYICRNCNTPRYVRPSPLHRPLRTSSTHNQGRQPSQTLVCYFSHTLVAFHAGFGVSCSMVWIS